MRDAVSQVEKEIGIAPGSHGSPARVRAWRRISLRKQMAFGFVVPLLIVLLASVSLVRTLDASSDSEAAIAESSEAMALRYTLLNLVLSAETGLRGYLITGSPDFLQPYHTVWTQLPQVFARLEETEADEPDHLAKLHEVRALLLLWREDFASPVIALRRRSPVGLHDDLRRLAATPPSAPSVGGSPTGEQARLLAVLQDRQRLVPAGPRAEELAAALSMVRSRGPYAPRLLALAERFQADERRLVAIAETRRGKHRIDRIRSLMQASFQEELAEQRSDAARATAEADRARWIAMLGPVTALAIGLSLILLLMFDAIRAITAATRAAVAVARGDLDKRVRVLRRDEIGALSTAFNLMAAELADRRRRSAAMDSFQALLITSNSIAETQEVTARMSEVMFPGMAGAIYAVSGSHDLAERLAQWNWPDIGQGQVWHPDECRAVRAAQPYCTGVNMVEIPCPHTASIGVPVSWSLCLPLAAQGEMLGVLQLCRFEDTPAVPFTDRQRESAELIAEQLSMSWANLQLREKLHNQSIRDPLTGLFNRRFLEETMIRELALAARTGNPLVVAVIDVDHFKRFNDRFGHEAGDLVLVELAAILQKFVRSSDIVCRYGGEEFVLLMPDSPLPVAIERAEALRVQVGKLRVRLGMDQLESVSISIGLASAQPGESAESLLRNADTALYAAKSAGRDRVEAYARP
ncbi:diguanylate cyclase [Lysobacter koreensis]|uniref:diguanylate cyclase n=1 Tax=Lysobacter koreensis TaxID=266122 RepID=A0ABW2YTF9_9GAMM